MESSNNRDAPGFSLRTTRNGISGDGGMFLWGGVPVQRNAPRRTPQRQPQRRQSGTSTGRDGQRTHSTPTEHNYRYGRENSHTSPSLRDDVRLLGSPEGRALVRTDPHNPIKGKGSVAARVREHVRRLLLFFVQCASGVAASRHSHSKYKQPPRLRENTTGERGLRKTQHHHSSTHRTDGRLCARRHNPDSTRTSFRCANERR
jgi:hypothetical protein